MTRISTRAESWCEALILHLNIKYCQATVRGERTLLSVAIGKKIEQPLDETYRVEFTYSVTASTPDYLAIDAHLGAAATPAPGRFGESLERWLTATERYAPQLHEVEHDAYLTMKRREYLRQQMLP
jgi:hypothetical protein